MDTGEHARIRWRCRRGLLELDLLLIPFAEQKYASLDAEQRGAFERLLNYPDQRLLEVLVNNDDNSDPALSDVINKIREASEN